MGTFTRNTDFVTRQPGRLDENVGGQHQSVANVGASAGVEARPASPALLNGLSGRQITVSGSAPVAPQAGNSTSTNAVGMFQPSTVNIHESGGDAPSAQAIGNDQQVDPAEWTYPEFEGVPYVPVIFNDPPTVGPLSRTQHGDVEGHGDVNDAAGEGSAMSAPDIQDIIMEDHTAGGTSGPSTIAILWYDNNDKGGRSGICMHNARCDVNGDSVSMKDVFKALKDTPEPRIRSRFRRASKSTSDIHVYTSVVPVNIAKDKAYQSGDNGFRFVAAFSDLLNNEDENGESTVYLAHSAHEATKKKASVLSVRVPMDVLYILDTSELQVTDDEPGDAPTRAPGEDIDDDKDKDSPAKSDDGVTSVEDERRKIFFTGRFPEVAKRKDTFGYGSEEAIYGKGYSNLRQCLDATEVLASLGLSVSGENKKVVKYEEGGAEISLDITTEDVRFWLKFGEAFKNYMTAAKKFSELGPKLTDSALACYEGVDGFEEAYHNIRAALGHYGEIQITQGTPKDAKEEAKHRVSRISHKDFVKNLTTVTEAMGLAWNIITTAHRLGQKGKACGCLKVVIFLCSAYGLLFVLAASVISICTLEYIQARITVLHYHSKSARKWLSLLPKHVDEWSCCET